VQTSASRLAEASGLARVAVCNHVNVLYVPGAGGLETVVLGTVTSASLVPNQTDAILERLDSMEKTLVAGSKQLDPACVRSKLGAQFDAPQPTMEVPERSPGVRTSNWSSTGSRPLRPLSVSRPLSGRVPGVFVASGRGGGWGRAG
jgi:hypothetical protein